jgi:cytochrome c oxidase subunit 2
VRRGSILQLLLFAIVAGGAAMTLALVPGWLPHPASREAGRIDFVFWFVTVICVAIFAIVAAVIVYSLLKFRASPDDDSDGAPIHGHTGLEIAWTAVPTVLVIAIAIVSAIVLAKNGHAGANPLRVNVTGQQFAWSFSYPSQGGITSGTLRLPVNRSVKLYLRSKDTDVIHSFWVPEFSQKQDLLPGMTTTVVITPDRIGSYPVVCTELCGLGHAVMRTTAIVMPQQAFAAWARQQGKAVKAGGSAGGKALFVGNGCNTCHTFKPAGANGKVGPDLDNLAQYAKTANQPLDKFVHDSIVDPKAYVQPGFQPIMPSFASLPATQVDQLVKYLVGKKGAS